MARLRTAAPRVGRLQPRVARLAETEADRSRLRDAAEGGRAWYKTARWQRLRWSVLLRDRGDEERFWAGPFQTLCKPCHDGAKQRSERSGRRASGWARRLGA